MRFAATVAAPLLVLGLAAQAQTNSPPSPQMPPDWITASNKPCKLWNPEPQAKETVTWSGECKDGFITGRGVLEWFEDGKSDIKFDGVYLNGKRNGPGVIILPNGQREQGLWIDDKPVRPAGNSI
jgi:hypothetical protein